jgi:hypothetical protein
MGLHADRAFNFLYSISEDGHFKLTELKNFTTVADLQPGQTGLKCMIYSDSRGAFIMADGDGYIYIYNQAAHPPEMVFKVQTQA